MILGADFLTLILVLAFASVVAYKVSFLKNKTIGHFSLLQIVYLVIIPGFLFPLAYSYLQSILARPLNEQIIISDGLLVNVVLLSMLFTYGGIAVHAATKMMSEVLRKEKSEVAKRANELNKYFHLKFSHNLVYSGIIVVVFSLTLLELNHVSNYNYKSIVPAIVKGVVLGLSLLTGMFFYTRSTDDLVGRWSDLKVTFIVFWLGFMTLLYGVRKIDPDLDEYQLLIPALLSLSLIGLLNVVLVVRKLKRGGWKVRVRENWLKRILKTVSGGMRV